METFKIEHSTKNMKLEVTYETRKLKAKLAEKYKWYWKCRRPKERLHISISIWLIYIFISIKSGKKSMYLPGYYQSANGAMVTHALGQMMYMIRITLIVLLQDLSTQCVMSQFQLVLHIWNVYATINVWFTC